MEEERTILCVANQKAGFLWHEETLKRVKYAAIEARVSESRWTEDVVLAALDAPPGEKKKNPFDV